MKKRYLILAALLALTVVAAGCGKKDDEEQKKQQEAQVTAAPTQAASNEEGLVEMQKPADDTEGITNIIGTKTETASKLIIINKTGSEVGELYVRPHDEEMDDEEWGEELVQGKFTLKNGEKALYYYDKNLKDDSGNAVTSYDICIRYTDEDRNDCFFRKLPMGSMTQISLCMDGIGEDGIPYARYLSGTGTKESSTLSEVKRRLGISDSSGSSDSSDSSDSDDSDDSSDSQSSGNSGNSGSTTAGTTPTAAPQPTTAPSGNDVGDDGNDGSTEEPQDEQASKAEGYIGQSLDALVGAMGDPTQGSDYQEEPETGETGYHYYDSFTVSTTVDEDGNEVVAGVW